MLPPPSVAAEAHASSRECEPFCIAEAQLYPSICYTVLSVCVQHQDNFLSYAGNISMNKPPRHATCDELNFERPLALQVWAEEWSPGWQVVFIWNVHHRLEIAG